MGEYAKDEELLIHSFQESLIGVAVTWYTSLESSRVHSWKDLVVAFDRQCQYNVFRKEATTEHVKKGDTNLSKNTLKGGEPGSSKWHLNDKKNDDNDSRHITSILLWKMVGYAPSKLCGFGLCQ